MELYSTLSGQELLLSPHAFTAAGLCQAWMLVPPWEECSRPMGVPCARCSVYRVLPMMKHTAEKPSRVALEPPTMGACQGTRPEAGNSGREVLLCWLPLTW